MIDADLISRAKAVPILEVAQAATRLRCGSRRAGEWFGPCPACGGTDRFSVNTKKQVFNCRQCKAKRDVIDLVRLIQGCDFRGAVEWLAGERIPGPAPRKPSPAIDPDTAISSNDNLASARRLWSETVPLPRTLGERYFVQHRGLAIGELGDLSHALCWHAGIRAVVALMTDPVTAEPRGIHRTFLNPDGSNKKRDDGKHDRKMLGPAGIIRLSPDENVHEGLGLVEGIEDGLVILLDCWAPIWSCVVAGGITRFPVLAGSSKWYRGGFELPSNCLSNTPANCLRTASNCLRTACALTLHTSIAVRSPLRRLGAAGL